MGILDRLSTGIETLDGVISGGLPRYATVLIGGAPGTGKTILAQQVLFKNRALGKVLYISTMSEPLIKLIRYHQGFSFFDGDAIMHSVIYHDISRVLRERGADQALAAINDLVMKHQPVVIAIDSLKAIIDLFESPHACRQFLADLNLKLSIWGCTVILVGEYSEGEVAWRPEAAMVDGIIYLYGPEERKHQRRFLRILKMRGSGFASGEHNMKITADGIRVFPRLKPDPDSPGSDHFMGYQRTGIAGLDHLLGGGIPRSTSTVISGHTGGGKSLISMGWLVAGAMEGEPGLLVTLDQTPWEIARNNRSLGWDLDKLQESNLLEIMYNAPVELDVDEFSHNIDRLVGQLGARRVVIDSISAFELGLEDKIKYVDLLRGIVASCKRQGASIFMTLESRLRSPMANLAQFGISYIADNVISCEMERDDHSLRRMVSVVKMRGGTHHLSLRELVVGGDGPELIEHPAQNMRKS